MSYQQFVSEKHVASVDRGSKAFATGTKQPIVTYAGVSGLGNVMVAIAPLSSRAVPTELGMVMGESYQVIVDTEALPAGAELREGDRLTLTASGGTYTLRTAELIERDGVGFWKCYAERKKA